MGIIINHKKDQVLVTIQRKWKSCVLLVRMENDASDVQNTMTIV
jgi:hypothetical protein